MFKNLDAAVDEAVRATNILPDHEAVYRRESRRLINRLAGSAAWNDVIEPVESGYFKLAVNEPHRLPKLMRTLAYGDVRAVMWALIEYNREH